MHAVAGDVGGPATLARAAALAEEAGGLHAWVNNAGITTHERLDRLTPERTERTLRTNLLATLEGCRLAVTAFMRERRAGAIVNVSSIHARAAFPGTPVYDATKGAIEALTRQLCIKYGHLGIRVNAVAPGAILTAATRRLLDESPDREATAAEWAWFAPAGRVLDPEEVADAVAFLLSGDARGVNGHVLAVDGGMAARAVAFPPIPSCFRRTRHERDRRHPLAVARRAPRRAAAPRAADAGAGPRGRRHARGADVHAHQLGVPVAAEPRDDPAHDLVHRDHRGR